ncbi:hypothetical protein PILCRDRAFT_63826 [Piloderma croceum F 1598]|uniref:Cyclic-AMP phosphodiesterase n=1 Tax=Piloderma croceum (strain F 1598) TaxID=765440 RepID=A0A0C3BMF8_PILCF|nr:hypothetical protein PILCRDRAFT_63826 [Piloderma croceum F 1598]
MPCFDMVVVGSGGGPDETNLSAYLIKPFHANWGDGIVALEAGSGMGALTQILKHTPDLFTSRLQDCNSAPGYSASAIYSFIRCFLITHAHLDHVNSLIISAGSLGGSRKRIFATEQTLHDLETVFADRIWPNLASWKEDDDSFRYLYTSLLTDDQYRNVATDISVRTMPISHGHNDTSGVYDSAAFFVRHDPSTREFLFFGDVSPDTLSPKPRTVNVWRAAAAKIPLTLSTIFIECSWPSGRADDLLYGHLSPIHLADELTVLATEVAMARKFVVKDLRNESGPTRKKSKSNPLSPESLYGALDGVRVFVIHCKDGHEVTYDRSINHIIADQVRALVAAKRLGADILAADQGMRIGASMILMHSI